MLTFAGKNGTSSFKIANDKSSLHESRHTTHWIEEEITEAEEAYDKDVSDVEEKLDKIKRSVIHEESSELNLDSSGEEDGVYTDNIFKN